MLYAAAGFKEVDFVAVLNVNAMVLPISQMRFNLLPKVVEVNDKLSNASLDQPLNLPIDEWSALYREHGFGCMVSQRRESGPPPRCQDHRFH